MRKSQATYIAQGALIASMYVILTEVSALFGLSGGVIQLRLAEILTVLPLYFTSAIPGLFIGCIISNIITGCALWDIVFGSLATLIAAYLTSKMKSCRYLASLPPIIANTIIVPPVLKFVYTGIDDAMWFIYLTVFVGELMSCGVLGTSLVFFIEKRKRCK